MENKRHLKPNLPQQKRLRVQPCSFAPRRGETILAAGRVKKRLYSQAWIGNQHFGFLSIVWAGKKAQKLVFPSISLTTGIKCD